jgi:ribosomal protein S12 methylthiotransferase
MKKKTSTQASQKIEATPTIISMVNLGCSKNLVDSERILGNLAEHGFLIAHDPAVADLCLVNTCGFINEAREETAGVLNELSLLKETGSLKTLVALGCLVERVADAPELNRFLQAADVRLGFKDYPRISEICHDLMDKAQAKDQDSEKNTALRHGPKVSAAKKPVPKSYNDFLISPRMRIGSPHTAFLKIAEGCSNPCRFCSIPRMRGLQVSRPIEYLVKEAQQLADGGAQEISIIAQDTTSYGRDLYQDYALPKLLRALKKVKGPRWFRLMYAFPKSLNEEMLNVLSEDERFCPYIDIPLQHIADDMLTAMARLVDKKQTMAQLDLIAKKLPHGAIRTTFIVGFPGETEEHVGELLDLVEEGRFTHAGAFLYSNEPLTPAAKFADTIPLKEKQARRDAIMLAQREVSRKRTASRLGSTVDVMIDSTFAKGATDIIKGAGAIARSQLEAPEVDGVIYLEGPGVGKLQPGDFVQATVTGALDYDLVAKKI